MKDRLREEYRSRQVAGLMRGAEKPEARSGKVAGTGEAREQAAAMMKVRPRYVQEAQSIREAAPEVFEAVKSGSMSIPGGTTVYRVLQKTSAASARGFGLRQFRRRAR